MEFEWGDRKAATNLNKHGVSFEEASTVFWDPLAATGADPDHSLGEQRWVTFGISDRGRLLVAVHAERHNCIRIISARPTTKIEQKIYEKA